MNKSTLSLYIANQNPEFTTCSLSRSCPRRIVDILGSLSMRPFIPTEVNLFASENQMPYDPPLMSEEKYQGGIEILDDSIYPDLRKLNEIVMQRPNTPQVCKTECNEQCYLINHQRIILPENEIKDPIKLKNPFVITGVINNSKLESLYRIPGQCPISPKTFFKMISDFIYLDRVNYKLEFDIDQQDDCYKCNLDCFVSATIKGSTLPPFAI